MRFVYGMMICIVLSAAVMPAQAQGILFVQKETQNGQSSTNQIQMDKTHMRAESHASGESMAFIFDGSKQIASMVNLNKKTYMEMTKADLEQTKKQLDSVMAQMQEQLKNLPPEQRQIVEQMMRGRGGLPGGPPAAAPKVQYRAAGSDKAGQWTCAKYEGYVGQQKTSEVCTVDPKEFGLSAADFDVARQFGDFMKTLMPTASGEMFVNGTPDDQGFSGIPVRQTSFQNGKVQSVREITEFRRETVPASAFEVPAGFRKEAAPGRE